jgi:hypothetical protein
MIDISQLVSKMMAYLMIVEVLNALEFVQFEWDGFTFLFKGFESIHLGQAH